MSARQPAGDPDRPGGDPDRPGGSASTADPVTITVCPDGPLLVRGNYQLLDGEDRPIDPGRATVALCRCGASAIKPFCDGSHKRTRFRAR